MSAKLYGDPTMRLFAALKDANRSDAEIAAQVRILVAQGANVNTSASQFGITPLHWAFKGGLFETVRVLEELGAEYKVDAWGGMPFDACAQAEDPKITHLFVVASSGIQLTADDLRNFMDADPQLDFSTSAFSENDLTAP